MRVRTRRPSWAPPSRTLSSRVRDHDPDLPYHGTVESGYGTMIYRNPVPYRFLAGVANLDSGVGVYAPDAEAYTLFAPLFNPLIQVYCPPDPGPRCRIRATVTLPYHAGVPQRIRARCEAACQGSGRGQGGRAGQPRPRRSLHQQVPYPVIPGIL